MATGTRTKIGLFAVGLLAGISLGVLFGYAIRAGLARLNLLHSSISQIDSREGQISKRLDTIESKISKKEGETRHGNPAYFTKPVAVAAVKVSDSSVTAKRIESGDSVQMQAADSNVVVMTDQMVKYETVPMVNRDTVMRGSAARKSDSLIADLNGTEETDAASCRVEFWESPINLKGYKMSRGKLILFGVNSTTPVRLIQYGGVFYILAGTDTYRAELTDDFRPFEKVTDRSLLQKIRQ